VAAVGRLRRDGIPRLLLVAPDASPPVRLDGDEDWLRRPAVDADVRDRVMALAAGRPPAHPGVANRPPAGRQPVERSPVERPPAERPVVGHGRIHYRRRWVALSGVEEAVTAELVGSFGDIVSLPVLVRAGGLALSNVGLRVHLTSIRKRVKPLGLVIRAVRSRGYVLDDEENSPG
jgi:hypothetical protein